MENTPGKISFGLLIALGASFVLGVGLMWGIGLLLINIQERKAEAKIPFQKVVEIGEDDLELRFGVKIFPINMTHLKRQKKPR